MPMSTAVHNSARFTYVSPAGHLDAGDAVDYGNVVDGGYFENSGLATLLEIYGILRDRGAVPYVLYLCNDPSSCGAPDRTSVASTAADELLSPVRALLKTRDARASLVQANLEDLARQRFLQLNVCKDLPAPLVPDPSQQDKAKARVVSPPLGWLLSSLARDWMDASLAGTTVNAQGSCYERNAYAFQELGKALSQQNRATR
jgi:hypothetical protein